MKYFNNKKEYVAYRKEWRNAVNSKEARATIATHDTYIVKEKGQILNLPTSYGGHYYVLKDAGKHKENGWTISAHYVLNNLLLEKDIFRGFNEITNINKLKNYDDEMFGFINGLKILIKLVKQAKKIEIDKNTEQLEEPMRDMTLKVSHDYALKWSEWKDTKLDGQLQNSTRKYYNEQLNYFLRPIKNTVTIALLAKIDLFELEKHFVFNILKKT